MFNSISFAFSFFSTFVSLAKISGGRNTPMTDLKEVKDLLDGPYEISKVKFYDRDYAKGGCCLVKTDSPEKAWVICLSLGIFFLFSCMFIFRFSACFDCVLYDCSICRSSTTSSKSMA